MNGLFALMAALVLPVYGPMDNVAFRKTIIDPVFRSEGVCVADVNGDGRLDILAGDLWYEAPRWTPHEIAPQVRYDPANGYSDCFACFAADINGDGRPDQIRIGMPGGPADWRENPGPSGGRWKRHEIVSSACNETPLFTSLSDRGRKPVLVFPVHERYMAWHEPGTDPTQPFTNHRVSEDGAPGTQRFSHGLGVGDLNGDRRPDVVTTEGYYASPADPRSGPWPFVPAKLGQPCANMIVMDVNGDRLADVVTSSAHGVGIWWFEQIRNGAGQEFIEHLIDNSFSQSHATVAADIDGDGTPDIVTGKRFWAHGPNGDIDPNAPALLCWYRLTRPSGKVTWTRYIIDDDSGVGTQFVVIDINKDRALDIVVSNKKGVFLFEQVRSKRR